jgi:hypothetical protein
MICLTDSALPVSCCAVRIESNRSNVFMNLLKPSGFFTYHQVQHSEILPGARFALGILYDLRTDRDLCFIHH